MTIATGSQALASDQLNIHAADGDLEFVASTELTIATGAITITQNWHRVDTESDAATDDLDTINGGTDGYVLFLRPENDARTVVVKHNTGNILCFGAANITLDDVSDIAIAIYDGNQSKWLVSNAVTASVAADSITNAMLRDSSGLSVIGRAANSTGDPADITAGNVGDFLRYSGTTVGFGKTTGAGKYFFGAATSNAKMTNGVTIDQGASDDEILALKSSDVAHGITDVAETDTYAAFKKALAPGGGLLIYAFSDGGALAPCFDVTTGDTSLDDAKSVTAYGAVQLRGAIKSGTGLAEAGANDNLLCVSSLNTTRFILDAEGDSHQDVGTAWTNFDEHDDVGLLTALSVHVSQPGDAIRENFREFLSVNRERLERLKLVTFNEDGHHFVNMSKLTMLLTGAVRQLGARLVDQGQRLERLERLMLASG